MYNILQSLHIFLQQKQLIHNQVSDYIHTKPTNLKMCMKCQNNRKSVKYLLVFSWNWEMHFLCWVVCTVCGLGSWQEFLFTDWEVWKRAVSIIPAVFRIMKLYMTTVFLLAAVWLPGTPVAEIKHKQTNQLFFSRGCDLIHYLDYLKNVRTFCPVESRPPISMYPLSLRQSDQSTFASWIVWWNSCLKREMQTVNYTTETTLI